MHLVVISEFDGPEGHSTEPGLNGVKRRDDAFPGLGAAAGGDAALPEFVVGAWAARVVIVVRLDILPPRVVTIPRLGVGVRLVVGFELVVEFGLVIVVRLDEPAALARARRAWTCVVRAVWRRMAARPAHRFGLQIC